MTPWRPSTNSHAHCPSLPSTGYDTSVAGNPHDAVEAFRSSEVFPDTVLIDADLPDFSATGALIKQLQGGGGGGG